MLDARSYDDLIVEVDLGVAFTFMNYTEVNRTLVIQAAKSLTAPEREFTVTIRLSDGIEQWTTYLLGIRMVEETDKTLLAKRESERVQELIARLILLRENATTTSAEADKTKVWNAFINSEGDVTIYFTEDMFFYDDFI